MKQNLVKEGSKSKSNSDQFIIVHTKKISEWTDDCYTSYYLFVFIQNQEENRKENKFKPEFFVVFMYVLSTHTHSHTHKKSRKVHKKIVLLLFWMLPENRVGPIRDVFVSIRPVWLDHWRHSVRQTDISNQDHFLLNHQPFLHFFYY